MKFTETKRIRYDGQCKTNPVYLRWLNSLGGWNYWLFSRNQIIEFTTGQEVIFENPITNLETSESFVEVLSVIVGKGMVLGANALDRNDIEFIKSIIYSPKVQWLFNPETWQTETPKWITVIPGRGSFPLIETKEERADISLTIKFPEIHTQHQ